MSSFPWVVTLSLLALSVAAGGGQAQGDEAPACVVYQVEAVGEIGYAGFARPVQTSGSVGVTGGGIPSSGNPLDVIVSFGRPVTQPASGSLAFVSNAYYAGNLVSAYRSGAVDLARVDVGTLEDGGVRIQATVPEDFTSNYGVNQGTMVNVLNWGSGLTANVKPIVGGSVVVDLHPDGTLSGVIEFRARDWSSYQTDILYRAALTGSTQASSGTVDACVMGNQ